MLHYGETAVTNNSILFTIIFAVLSNDSLVYWVLCLIGKKQLLDKGDHEKRR